MYFIQWTPPYSVSYSSLPELTCLPGLGDVNMRTRKFTALWTRKTLPYFPHTRLNWVLRFYPKKMITFVQKGSKSMVPFTHPSRARIRSRVPIKLWLWGLLIKRICIFYSYVNWAKSLKITSTCILCPERQTFTEFVPRTHILSDLGNNLEHMVHHCSFVCDSSTFKCPSIGDWEKNIIVNVYEGIM